jgi:DEAD/DEAH box helicase domain-containing protein
VDFPSALVFLHEKAIYIHGGQQHHIEHLDFKERKAYVKRVDVDYYTDAVRYTQVRVLEIASTEQGVSNYRTAHCHSHGDVLVRSQVVGFKKIKFFTNENIGDGKLELPENEMHTTSYWITLERSLLESLPFSISERQSGMFGLLHALESVATLLLMCDRRDLGTGIGERPPAAGSDSSDVRAQHPDMVGTRAALLHGMMENFTPSRMEEAISSNGKEFFEPNLYLYDAYPGGIGFSEPLFRTHELLMQKTRELIAACPCEQGCPSCVGPAGDLAPRAKEAALAILGRLCA